MVYLLDKNGDRHTCFNIHAILSPIILTVNNVSNSYNHINKHNISNYDDSNSEDTVIRK